MNYRELLPENCPPDQAEEIATARVVYRLVRCNPPVLDDFRSQRAEKPGAIFSGVDECKARGVSVYANLADCDKTLKLPRFRSHHVCKVALDQGAGRIQQTFQPSHHTMVAVGGF
ncbi:hypothetical protein MTYM_02302 [Methylococcales bacterium]|nr:hypothetical protein MTYM_02302 [Methylococcales bacterium]